MSKPTKERGIILADWQVRALLDGRATQIREPLDAKRYGLSACDWATMALASAIIDDVAPAGSRLWVREPYHCVADHELGDGPWPRKQIPLGTSGSHSRLFAVYGAPRAAFPIYETASHMSRDASRLTLDVERAWLHPLQDISEDDAKASGCAPAWLDTDGECVNWGGAPTFLQGFARAWSERFGKRFPWTSNPLVLARQVRVVEVKR